MRIAKISVVLLIAGSLPGCVSAEHAKQEAIKKLQDQCTAQGKQFVLIDAKAQQHFAVIASSAEAEVEGQCVGPGQPGYVPPPGEAPAG